MLKLLQAATRLVRRRFAAARGGHSSGSADWANDPFAAPELRRMTQAQLADLPFERGAAPEAPPAERTVR